MPCLQILGLVLGPQSTEWDGGSKPKLLETGWNHVLLVTADLGCLFICGEGGGPAEQGLWLDC